MIGWNWVIATLMAIAGIASLVIGYTAAEPHENIYAGTIFLEQEECFKQTVSQPWVIYSKLEPICKSMPSCIDNYCWDNSTCLCELGTKQCTNDMKFKVITKNEPGRFPFGEQEESVPAPQLMLTIAGATFLALAPLVGFTLKDKYDG